MSSHHTVPALLNKVPEVTVYFWVIKVLCTTVGESAADYFNIDLGFGLTRTSVATGVLLIAALALQIGARRYIPYRYWLTVTLVNVFGTLVTDNLTDNPGLPLEASTLVFSVVLAAVFLAWYRRERTLSIHSIVTRRRERFYWLAILFTFALGTATGDLMAEVLGLGYLVAGGIVAAAIAVTAVGWRLGLHPVLSFWIIYILTRPLGASLGDHLSQPTDVGGLDLGATLTSVIFLAAILATVVYLTLTKADVITSRWRTGAATDLSQFRTITQDTLTLLNAGNQSGATTRVDDLETTGDHAQARLRAKNRSAWDDIDCKIDTFLAELRAAPPNPDSEKSALTTLLTALT